ncbi:MAG TPA: hypothetical protein PKE64_14280 [Anaerolineae bacterium]|nr:hypothetical protein [Anaerolineae bacterium]
MTINWRQKDQAQRQRYWFEVEQFFADLPPHLFQQGIQLQNNLATFHSDTGQFRDILSRESDHPLLYLHLWLLDDLGAITPPALARDLFLAMAFTFAAAACQETVWDESSNLDRRFLLLREGLDRRAQREWHSILQPDSPFWNDYQRIWDAYAEAVLADLAEGDDSQTRRLVANQIAFTKLGAIGAAHALNRANLVPQLETLLDGLNFVHQILRQISTIRSDLAHRRLTYPILKTLQAAGLTPHEPYSPERVLGALILTTATDEIRQTCLEALATARGIAAALKLPTFGHQIDSINKQVETVISLFSLRPSNLPESQTAPARPVFAPFVETLPKVIQMAEGYLLADLTFRESWEIQRRGFFGPTELVGQAFPMAFVAEILAGHGHKMSPVIAEIFRTLQSTGFRYYNHAHLPPDADDVGFVLRLYPASAQSDFEQGILRTALALLQMSVDESGGLPVWLQPLDPPEGDQPLVALWGARCATVEAHVLLGVLQLSSELTPSWFENAAANWLERIGYAGIGAGWHYIPLYTLYIGFELIAALTGHASSQPLTDKIEVAQQTLLNRLRLEIERLSLSAQEAALLILACLSAGAPAQARALFRGAWITRLCKTQRYDGAWAAEPLYGTPTRGEFAAWYASQTVTTALAYHALKRYRYADSH